MTYLQLLRSCPPVRQLSLSLPIRQQVATTVLSPWPVGNDHAHAYPSSDLMQHPNRAPCGHVLAVSTVNVHARNVYSTLTLFHVYTDYTPCIVINTRLSRWGPRPVNPSVVSRWVLR